MGCFVWIGGLLACLASLHPYVHANEEIVEMRLQSVKALRGVVLDPNGDPVKGAKVAELTPDWRRELRATNTDSDGRFALTSVKGRKVYYLQISAPDVEGVNPLRVPAKINRLWSRGLLRLQLKLA